MPKRPIGRVFQSKVNLPQDAVIKELKSGD
jgi:hypothetical protein